MACPWTLSALSEVSQRGCRVCLLASHTIPPSLLFPSLRRPDFALGTMRHGDTFLRSLAWDPELMHAAAAFYGDKGTNTQEQTAYVLAEAEVRVPRTKADIAACEKARIRSDVGHMVWRWKTKGPHTSTVDISLGPTPLGWTRPPDKARVFTVRPPAAPLARRTPASQLPDEGASEARRAVVLEHGDKVLALAGGVHRQHIRAIAVLPPASKVSAIIATPTRGAAQAAPVAGAAAAPDQPAQPALAHAGQSTEVHHAILRHMRAFAATCSKALEVALTVVDKRYTASTGEMTLEDFSVTPFSIEAVAWGDLPAGASSILLAVSLRSARGLGRGGGGERERESATERWR